MTVLLAKLESALQFVESRINKPLCILLGVIIGYIAHLPLTLIVDIIKIPFKIIGLF